MTESAILEELNDKQRQAVTAPTGNLLLLAGAGSGKTKTLVCSIAWRIMHYGLSPHAILAVTFTNKAAGEMKERLQTLLGQPVVGMWVGTFHGLCHRMLRRHFDEAGLPETFHILDSEDQARLIKRVIASLNLSEEQWPVRQAQAFINGNKDEGLRPQHVRQTDYGPTRTLLRIYQAYEQACQTAGVIDFAEILLRAYELLRNNPELSAHYQQRFQAIFVDEFQDTNAIQYAWIRLMAGACAPVMAVGDDDQSIYGWRGARVENIQKFINDFSDTTVIRLEQNYRSTATILNAANALISNNQDRMGKNLWTQGEVGEKIIVYSAFNELDEARFVSERIQLALREGYALNDMAILYRSNAQSRVLEEALLRAGIAYRIYGGVRFFERAEIKDALAYFRLLANVNDDTAFERVVNFPTRGLGEKTLDELRGHARSNQQSLWWAAQDILAREALPARARSNLKQFIDLIGELQQQCDHAELDEQMNSVIQGSGLYAHFSKLKGDKAESRIDNLQELVNAAKQFRYEYNEEEDELPILTAFLSHASLEAGEMQARAHEHDFVHMMTLHSAKGLEFPLVFMVGLEEGVFPGRQSVSEPGRLEEERRLCYVGMTRARQKLVMSYAEVRRLYGREEYHRPSRFVRELPSDYLDELRVNACYQAPVRESGHCAVASKEAAQQAGLKLSQNVHHEKFGRGVVLAVEGSGAHTRVQIKFAEHGIKWLVLAYANLTIMENCS